jgi:hypothetical protein
MVMIKCPVCNGRGKLASPSRVPDTALRQEAAVTLVGSGFSYRETMRLLGYKSPRSVVQAMKKPSFSKNK